MKMLTSGHRPAMLARPTTTREQWLNAFTEKVRPWYMGELPPTIHASVGFTSSGMRGKAIGECWHPAASSDDCPQIFVHPKISDGTEVAAILCHEFVHACRPEAKHGPQFKALAVQIGLTGKMTQTVASDDLRDTLDAIVAELGPYPHPTLSARGGKPKQSTRMLKVQCPECDYTVRTTAKWLEVGFPACPCGTEMYCPDEGDEV